MTVVPLSNTFRIIFGPVSYTHLDVYKRQLYYRLGVAFVEVPPLRERREDIGLLFDHFALLAASRYGRELPELQPAQRAELMTHDWPGNLRELGNVATRFVLGLGGARLTPGAGASPPGPMQSLHEQMEQFERALIADTLRQQHGDVTASAKAMGCLLYTSRCV